jgi:CheY-like chemotaxis protein
MSSQETTKTLLLVEDDEIASAAVATLLSRHGYEVARAEDGKEALEYLEAHAPPDLILLDMFLPVLDGWRFLERLKGHPAAPVPVVVTTGSILTPEWAQDHGCAGFVKKPIEETVLLEEVRRCLTAEAAG